MLEYGFDTCEANLLDPQPFQLCNVDEEISKIAKRDSKIARGYLDVDLMG